MNANEIATKADIEEIKDLMRKMMKSTEEFNEPNRIMDGNQVKEFLGISEGTLKMLCDTKELIRSKVYGKYYYEMKDIMDMIRRNKVRN